MILYALKADEGYLKMSGNNEFQLVGINKASVYAESDLDQLMVVKKTLKKQLSKLRIIKLSLEETDFYR